MRCDSPLGGPRISTVLVYRPWIRILNYLFFTLFLRVKTVLTYIAYPLTINLLPYTPTLPLTVHQSHSYSPWYAH